MSLRILAINPGSTSTKLSLSEDGREIRSLNIGHITEELLTFPRVIDQEEYRYLVIQQKFLSSTDSEIEQLDAIIGRGGLLKPLEGGVYRVSQSMLNDLKAAEYGEHASNLGAVLAERIAAGYRKNGRSCDALIADPVVVDELCPEARLSGLPLLERRSIFHALSQKSVGRLMAERLGKPYEQLNLIIAHMGGGVSVGAHCLGRVIDVNNALDGDGPFSPERSGGLPAGQLSSLVMSGKYTENEIKKMITGKGGLYAYSATKDLRELLALMAEDDKQAVLAYRAMIFQISQEISKHGATLKGKIDGIGVTGGLANSTDLIRDIKERVSYLAPVFVFPGEREMEALMENALDALQGKQKIKEYVG